MNTRTEIVSSFYNQVDEDSRLQRSRHETTFERFDSLPADGKPVGKQEDTAESGSLILTLKASCLNTLPLGKHLVKITFSEGGEVHTNANILPAPEVPKTGDSASPILWLTLTLAGGGPDMFLWRCSPETPQSRAL